MFGAATRVCGCPRIFPVKDDTLRRDVVQTVKSRDPRTGVPRFTDRDLRCAHEDTFVAVNVAGRQCHLLMTIHGGRSVSFLVHVPSNSVDLIPVRFDARRHESHTLARCTFSPKSRLLVVDDMCDDRGVRERATNVHDLVHDDHTPDAYLFPMRVVSRRLFNRANVSDVKRLVQNPEIVVHSLAVIDAREGVEHTKPEKRIFPDATTGRSSYTVSAAPGMVPDALVKRAPGPESYNVSVDGGRSWNALSVQTMDESRALELAFSNVVVEGGYVRSAVTRHAGSWRVVAPRAPLTAPFYGP